MSGAWQSLRWGDVATLEYGKGLRGYEGGVGAYRVYGTNGPIGWHSESLCEHATVVVGRKGAYRGVHYSPFPCWVIDTAFSLVPKIEFDMRWAYYQLLTQDINGMDSGSAIPSTSRDAFYSLPVDVPPLPEQRAIAHVLGTLDDKIELNRQMNRTLEETARALFRSWFVDFDPVRAKAAGRPPAGLDAATAALFPDAFGESEAVESPTGWCARPLKYLVSLCRQTLNPANFPDEEFDHYSIPAYDEGQMPKVERGRTIRSNKNMVPEGVVLVSKLNPRLPRVWLPRTNSDRRSICSTEFLATMPRCSEIQPFVYALLTSDAFATRFASMVTGTSGSHQ